MAPKKPIDFGAAFAGLNESSQAAADDRFARASKVLQTQPSAFQTIPDSGPVSKPAGAFDISACYVGGTFAIPINMIVANPVGIRHLYKVSVIEEMVETMQGDGGGQDVALNGFINADGKVELFDGGTRLRSGRASGYQTLDVKIEEPPADLREQFLRSARLNDNRTGHNELDIALSCKMLMDLGIYKSQDEMAEDLSKIRGKRLVKSQISTYMRISRIPERILAKMNEHELTSDLTHAYAISSLFEESADQAEREKIAEEVIQAVVDRQLNKAQTQALIDSKVLGKKKRSSSVSQPVKYGQYEGTFRIFPTKGQIQFTMQGLDEATTEKVRDLIENALSS